MNKNQLIVHILEFGINIEDNEWECTVTLELTRPESQWYSLLAGESWPSYLTLEENSGKMRIIIPTVYMFLPVLEQIQNA